MLAVGERRTAAAGVDVEEGRPILEGEVLRPPLRRPRLVGGEVAPMRVA